MRIGEKCLHQNQINLAGPAINLAGLSRISVAMACNDDVQWPGFLCFI
jgi:hypothetical protein